MSAVTLECSNLEANALGNVDCSLRVRAALTAYSYSVAAEGIQNYMFTLKEMMMHHASIMLS